VLEFIIVGTGSGILIEISFNLFSQSLVKLEQDGHFLIARIWAWVIDLNRAGTYSGVLIEITIFLFSNLGEAQTSWSPCDHLDLNLSAWDYHCRYWK
jgi:hypothetical protein